MEGSAKALSPQDLRNLKRRMEYAHDESYRQTCIEVSRENYRRENNVVLRSCLGNLGKLTDFGAIREVYLGKQITPLRCYSVAELAKILGYSATILYRWKSKGQLPGPIFEAKVEVFSKTREVTFGSTMRVYLEAEVKGIVEVIGEHQQEFCYYRKSDVHVKKKLFAAVDAARKKQ